MKLYGVVIIKLYFLWYKYTVCFLAIRIFSLIFGTPGSSRCSASAFWQTIMLRDKPGGPWNSESELIHENVLCSARPRRVEKRAYCMKTVKAKILSELNTIIQRLNCFSSSTYNCDKNCWTSPLFLCNHNLTTAVDTQALGESFLLLISFSQTTTSVTITPDLFLVVSYEKIVWLLQSIIPPLLTIFS